ncbi:MAG: phage major capsid protein, partial [Cetobacterium sp.]
MPQKNISFGVSLEEFAEKVEKKGCFSGILVNYNHKNLAHGNYKFSKGSMKNNEGKTMLLLYNHAGNNIPVGTCKGYETEKGFEIEAQLQLTQDETGAYLNSNAAALYDLMKNQGAKFELSAGGIISKGGTKEENVDGRKTYYYSIDEFNAH